MVLRQLRHYRPTRSGDCSRLGRSRRIDSCRCLRRACAIGSPTHAVVRPSPAGPVLSLELCKLAWRDRHKLVFVQNDSLAAANELPPLSRGTEHDRRYHHEKEYSNQRVKPPDTCLSYEFSCLICVGHS